MVEKEISLKVGELTAREEAGRGIVRLDTNTMGQLGIKEGENKPGTRQQYRKYQCQSICIILENEVGTGNFKRMRQQPEGSRHNKANGMTRNHLSYRRNPDYEA